MFPKTRLKRLRQNAAIRSLLSETNFSPKNLIQPYFVTSGTRKKKAIDSMPGVYHLSIDYLLDEIARAKKNGIGTVLLFGISDRKDRGAVAACQKNDIIPKAIKAIRKKFKNSIVIMTDVCLCGYTPHGHCGVVKNKKIDNDATLRVLAKIALNHATAGADFVSPSAMTDGQVKAIRNALDRKGFKDTGIMAYSAKYASNFYGPFREAYDSSPQYGNRKYYQMDSSNSREALREVREDIEEGADIVMVKPALAYLDVIQKIEEKFHVPLAAYNVSGEYSIIKAAAERGFVNEKETVLETLLSMKRAGANLVITYYANEAAKWLKK